MSKIVFLFPGQGAQAVGMGRALSQHCPAARDLYDQAADVLGFDLARLCFDGPADRLNSTVVSQPALFVTSLAALATLRDQDPDRVGACRAAAGLSLGEYTALVMAGAIDFPSGLKLVALRGHAMQEASDATPGTMLSVLGLDLTRLRELCEAARGEEVLQIANLLCPGNLVVSGSVSACERLERAAKDAGAMKVIRLAVAGAFHTTLMQPAVERLRRALAETTIQRPAIPVISNVDAKAHDDPETIRRLLVEQLVRPVRWEESIRGLLDDGYDRFYEIGPGRVLRGLLRRIHRKVPCDNIAA